MIVALASSLSAKLYGQGGGWIPHYGLPEEDAFAQAARERDDANAALSDALDKFHDSKTAEEKKENRKKAEDAKKRYLDAAKKYNDMLEAMLKAQREHEKKLWQEMMARLAKELQKKEEQQAATESWYKVAPGLQRFLIYRNDLTSIQKTLTNIGINLRDIPDTTALNVYVSQDKTLTIPEKEKVIEFFNDVSFGMPGAGVSEIINNAGRIADQLGTIQKLENTGVLAPTVTGEEIHLGPFKPPTKPVEKPKATGTSIEPGSGNTDVVH